VSTLSIDLGNGYSRVDKKGRIPALMQLTIKQEKQAIDDA